MTMRLKPLYGYAFGLAIALVLTAGASVTQIGAPQALANLSNEPAPAPATTTTKKKKKIKAKKKKKRKFKDDSDSSSLEQDLQPSYAPARRPDLTLANAQIKAGEYRAAIITLNRMERPGDANVLNLLGFSHRKLGLVDVGMRYYLAALERNPQHQGVHEYLGEAYLQKDDLAKAQIMLKKLGQMCGTDCKHYQDLAAAIADYKNKHSL